MKIGRIPKKGLGAAALTAALAASTVTPASPVAAAERESFTMYSSKEELKDAYLAELSTNRGLPLCVESDAGQEAKQGKEAPEEITDGDEPRTDDAPDTSGEGSSSDDPEVVEPVEDAGESAKSDPTTSPTGDASSDSSPTVSARSAGLSGGDAARSIEGESSGPQDASAAEDSVLGGEPAVSDENADPNPVEEPSSGAGLSENSPNEGSEDDSPLEPPVDSSPQDESSDSVDDPANLTEVTEEDAGDDGVVECIDPGDVTLEFETRMVNAVATEDGFVRQGEYQGRDFSELIGMQTPARANAVDIANQDPDNSVSVVTVEREPDGDIVVEKTPEMPKDQAVEVIAEEQRKHDNLVVTVDTPVSVNYEWDNSGYLAPTNSLFDTPEGWLTSSDTYRDTQNYLDPDRPNLAFSRNTGVNNIEYVWKYTRGAGVTVAVIDTGVDGTHPDLEGAVLPGIDLVDGTEGDQEAWNDGNTHGTHVAGIIAAQYDNGIGITGIAPDAKILPVKALGDSGSGLASDVAQGVIDAVDAGADILNMSLGSFSPNAALEAAVAYANSKGVVVVAAGGNSPNGNYYYDGVNYPASYPNVIGVTSNSSWCAGIGGDHIDIAAPGCSIWSTVPGGGYAQKTGSSMATPHVAGAMALMLASGVDATSAENALLRYTGRHSAVLAKECTLNEEKSTPGNTYYDCVTTGIDEEATQQKYGSGLMMHQQAFGYARGVTLYDWVAGEYWTASSSAPSAPAPSAPAPSAPSGGGGGSAPAAPAPSGGSSSSGSSAGGGGGGVTAITTIVPKASGAPGTKIALAGWGLETTRAVTFGEEYEAEFTVVSGGQIDVIVPDIPDGTYAVHAVLAPEVGRASYWSPGFTVMRTDTPVTTQPGIQSPATSQTDAVVEAKMLTFTPEGMAIALPDKTTKAKVFRYRPKAKKKWKLVDTLTTRELAQARSTANGDIVTWLPERHGRYRVVALTPEGKDRSNLLWVSRAALNEVQR